VKRIVLFLAAGMMVNLAQAQDSPEEMEIVLPDIAQKCVLPASPDAIPEDATLDQLKASKSDVNTFQEQVVVYRDCLNEADADPELTPGNKQAIVNAYNYSVEMEERVAERFNEAVRSYKERKAQSEDS
jgi:hypothetical protein